MAVSVKVRFFASLRLAKTDKVPYLLGNKILMIAKASVTVSFSN